MHFPLHRIQSLSRAVKLKHVIKMLDFVTALLNRYGVRKSLRTASRPLPLTSQRRRPLRPKLAPAGTSRPRTPCPAPEPNLSSASGLGSCSPGSGAVPDQQERRLRWCRELSPEPSAARQRSCEGPGCAEELAVVVGHTCQHVEQKFGCKA